MAKIVKHGDTKKGTKAGGVPPVSRPASVDLFPESGAVVHKRVLDAKEKAEQILTQAQAEATRIHDEAERVLEDTKVKREKSIKKGYAEGESKGLAQVTEKLIQLQRLREEFYQQAEPEVIRLVMSIAEKVIGQIVEENPKLIRSVIKKALERSLGDRIVVRLSPEDYKVATAEESEFREVIDRTKRITFRQDDTIAKGGCVVETEVGTIDAQIETQLKAIRKALMS
jgi:flagellar biosynthesis/type III secretory pathway protein FliH